MLRQAGHLPLLLISKLELMVPPLLCPSLHRAAAEQYSRAIACKVEDEKYNAVLYLNRAACYQAMKNFLRCISDCCTSANLDPAMPK